MRKTFVIVATALVVVTAACGKSSDKKASGPTGPQSYAVDADAAAQPQFQVATYFPSKLTVRPGDTIVFTNRSKAHPHTITFGIKADQSNRPPTVTDKGENPVAFGPCFQDAAPTNALTACATPPNPASPPAFNGTGFWNSGIIGSLGGSNQQTAITMKLGDSIAPGDYQYLCMLHPFMIGVLTVAAKDGERQAPTAVRAAADTASAKAVTATAALNPPAATPNTITAGWGDGITAVMGYAPDTIAVKVGDLVTWKDVSPYEPHTVTFASPFKAPDEPGALDPAGVKSGGTYTSGLTSSGLIGPPPLSQSAEFSLKFAKPGTYKYVCTIHPGMAGSVVVS